MPPIPVFDQNVGAQFIAPGPVEPDNQAKSDNQGAMNRMNQGAMNRAPTVGEIVRALKARCTHDINQTRNTLGAPVWQRNYYERVIRNDNELSAIREYITHNPQQWAMDIDNPNNAP